MAKQPKDNNENIRPEVAAVTTAIPKLQDRHEQLKKINRDLQIQIDSLFAGSYIRKKGTQIMEDLLNHHNGSMKSSDLAREAAISSLIKRKAIRW